MLKLITVIVNSVDGGTVEKHFPEDLKYTLEKCKQPFCVL